jgi:hypothetical protein
MHKSSNFALTIRITDTTPIFTAIFARDFDERLVLADADAFGKICEEFERFAGFVDDHLPLEQKLSKTREFLEPF